MNISDRIQAFELALYITGKADLLIFLKHLGLSDFPITRGGNLWEPTELAQKRTEIRLLSYKLIKNILMKILFFKKDKFLTILRLAIAPVLNVWLGSILKKRPVSSAL